MNQTVIADDKKNVTTVNVTTFVVDQTLVKLLSDLFEKLANTHLKQGQEIYLRRELPSALDKLAESLEHVAAFKVLPNILKASLNHYHLADALDAIVTLRADYYRVNRGEAAKVMNVKLQGKQPATINDFSAACLHYATHLKALATELRVARDNASADDNKVLQHARGRFSVTTAKMLRAATTSTASTVASSAPAQPERSTSPRPKPSKTRSAITVQADIRREQAKVLKRQENAVMKVASVFEQLDKKAQAESQTMAARPRGSAGNQRAAARRGSGQPPVRSTPLHAHSFNKPVSETPEVRASQARSASVQPTTPQVGAVTTTEASSADSVYTPTTVTFTESKPVARDNTVRSVQAEAKRLASIFTDGSKAEPTPPTPALSHRGSLARISSSALLKSLKAVESAQNAASNNAVANPFLGRVNSIRGQFEQQAQDNAKPVIRKNR